jgi:hypothetical protein
MPEVPTNGGELKRIGEPSGIRFNSLNSLA